MNLNNTIIPKSDQLNADDLISGPRTIKITAVEAGTAEQPVIVRYEGDTGRPYKPGKSMRRVLVAMWGSEGGAYIGRRLTLYRDVNIKFGGDAVGGIRISHASDITETVVLGLTETRGKRKKFTVEPLPREESRKPAPASPQPTDAPVRDLQTLCDIADGKIAEGLDDLLSWGNALPKAEKLLIGGKRFEEWKARAAE